MNVLITSAGRRTSLLEAFKHAVEKRNGRVFAADLDHLAPALYFAHGAFKLPLIAGPEYTESLKQIVAENDIKVVIPTIDTELPVMARMRDEFLKKGCRIIVSSYELIDIAQDKWKTVQFFKERGISVPKSWLPESELASSSEKQGSIPEVVFIKPRNGSASQFTFRLKKEEVSSFASIVPSPIIQEHLPHTEITVDALLDLNGDLVHYVPRKRIRTVGGESIQGVTLPDNDVRDWLIKLLNIISELGGIGPITIQYFLSPDGPILSEINPRFGGGFPLTLAAGGHYPEWILQMVEGKRVEHKIGEYRVGLYMSRYYSELIFDEPVW